MPISITLDSVTCVATSAGPTADEVYIVYQADAGIPRHVPRRFTAPHSMGNGETWNVGQEMEFNRDLLVTLYDHDESLTDTRSDFLVSYDYTPDSLPGSVTVSNNDGAQYTLKITVNN
ncbi:hypothetical protein [Ramlibacter sp. WS9]|uniref:hypothetical protein n=1 Tax=Ramlibacter sp. WS9 TaxID=1882741 RepID=UPI001143002B|nr:hypothetical protein [Ramlibacter sp. WS9]ROZ69015.1 hypothetical protein EEB15_24410 [Ramlibacter sp. WS9]